MNRFVCLILTAILPTWCCAKEKTRPKILQILQVHVLTSHPQDAHAFYYGILRTLALSDSNETKCNWCEKISTDTNGPVLLDPIQGPLPNDLLSAVVLRTDDAEALRKYLDKKKIKVGKLSRWPPGPTFVVCDPEGHRLIFFQTPDSSQPTLGYAGAYTAPSPHWPHIIHAGLIVKDRAAMDHFYEDVLGFHVYWQGGRTDSGTDWVDMQLPDGTDWIEYMLNVPSNADQQTRGIMNHFAVGVVNMRAADEQLLGANLRFPVNQSPKIGRDGKWQLNLYDPDGTRVELMEFTPVEKPCCNDYTGPHPRP
jgi:catechol 2,3-dioxygenase-like lactoylglutathione lyase family enzyme